MIFILILLVAVLLAASYLGQFRDWETMRITWFATGAGSLIITAVFKKAERLDWLSSPVAYTLVFWLFHFGLVLPVSICPSILDRFDPWDVRWTRYPEGGKAALLSLLFLVAFFLGWMLMHLARQEPERAAECEFAAPELVMMGRMVVLGGLLLATIGIGHFGSEVFLKSYEQFFELHTIFSSAVVLVAYGFALQLAGGLPLRIVLYSMVWGYLPIAMLTFLVGVRTAPLVTAVVIGVVIAHRRARIPRFGLGIAAGVVLLSIALVRETRQYGLSETLSGRVEVAVASPLGGMIELGGSLRPVAVTVHYIEVAHNEWLYGQTYVYPVWRAVQRVVGLPRSDPQTDPRFIASHIGRLYHSAMGYSVVAEGFVNAGAPGVLLFALVWGMVLAMLERYADRPYGMAVLAAVMIPMITNIRNTFIFVPAWIFFAVSPLAISNFLSGQICNRSRR